MKRVAQIFLFMTLSAYLNYWGYASTNELVRKEIIVAGKPATFQLVFSPFEQRMQFGEKVATNVGDLFELRKLAPADSFKTSNVVWRDFLVNATPHIPRRWNADIVGSSEDNSNQVAILLGSFSFCIHVCELDKPPGDVPDFVGGKDVVIVPILGKSPKIICPPHEVFSTISGCMTNLALNEHPGELVVTVHCQEAKSYRYQWNKSSHQWKWDVLHDSLAVPSVRK